MNVYFSQTTTMVNEVQNNKNNLQMYKCNPLEQRYLCILSIKPPPKYESLKLIYKDTCYNVNFEFRMGMTSNLVTHLD